MAFNNEYPYVDPNRVNIDWILGEIKRIADEWAQNLNNLNDIKKAFDDLYKYVHDYFDNLDVSEEVSEFINERINNGTLQEWFTTYLAENFDFNEDVDCEIFAQIWAKTRTTTHTLQSCEAYELDGVPYLFSVMAISDSAHADYGDKGDVIINNLLTGTRTYEQELSIGHGNSSTYNALLETVIFTNQFNNVLNLFNVRTTALSTVELNPTYVDNVHGIAYDNINDNYIIFYRKGTKWYLARLDNEFDNITNIREVTAFPTAASYGGQGIHYDGKFVYWCIGDYERNSNLVHNGNHILIFEAQSFTFLKSVYAPFKNELEDVFSWNGQHYVVYTGGDNAGFICKANIFNNYQKLYTADQSKMKYGIYQYSKYDDLFVADYTHSKFFCNNSSDEPFCEPYLAFSYLQCLEDRGTRVNFLANVDMNINVFNANKPLLIFNFNGYEYSGQMNIYNVSRFTLQNVNLTGGEGQLHLYNVQDCRLNTVHCLTDVTNQIKADYSNVVLLGGCTWVNQNAMTASGRASITIYQDLDKLYLFNQMNSVSVGGTGVTTYYRAITPDAVVTEHITLNNVDLNDIRNNYYGIRVNANCTNIPTNASGVLTVELAGYQVKQVYTTLAASDTPTVYTRYLYFGDGLLNSPTNVTNWQ